MMKLNKRIEIVRSDKSGLSSMSQLSARSAQAVLAKYYETVQITAVNDYKDLRDLVRRQPDLVFLGMEYVLQDSVSGLKSTEKVWLADYLDKHSAAYTGSRRLAHELQRSKPLAKNRVQAAGLQTAPYFVVQRGQTLAQSEMPLAFPVFIKPTNGGGGQGVDSASLAHTFEQLVSKINSIADKTHADSLIEAYLPGREFSVAILKKEYSDEYDVMPIELVAPLDQNGVRMLSCAVKSADAEKTIAISDLATKTIISQFALDAFQALGARDYGRIDIRLDVNDVPHFLEANLIPSLISGYGSFPKACVINLNLDYETMIMRIARLGLKRRINQRSLAQARFRRDGFNLLPSHF